MALDLNHFVPENKEQEFTYRVLADMPGFNEQRFLRPETYCRLAGDVIEEHLGNVTGSIPYMIEHYGVSWALIAIHFYIFRQVEQDEPLIAHTWCSGIRSAFFLRDVMFWDEQERPVFGVGTTSVLIDLEKRAMMKDGRAYDDMKFEVGERLFKNQVKMRTKGLDLADCGSVIVEPSWLDSMGHMNNTRYAEVFYNHCSQTARSRLGEMTELEVHFQQEMNVGEEILLTSWEDEGQAVMEGHKKNEDGTPGHLAFASRIKFGE